MNEDFGMMLVGALIWILFIAFLIFLFRSRKKSKETSSNTAFKMSDTVPITPVEKWITATYAVWAESFDFDTRYIGACEDRSKENVEFMQDVLRDSWGITNRTELLDEVEDLTMDYLEADIETANSKSFGWDLCRACQIMGMAYVARYIDRETLVNESVKVAVLMQRFASSWEELYKSYIIGFIMWKSRYSDDIDEDVKNRQRAADRVLQKEDGPRNLDWNLHF